MKESLIKRVEELTITHAPIGSIHLSERALRVARIDHKEFPGFCRNVAENGVVNPIILNNAEWTKETMPPEFENSLVDGAQRLEATKVFWRDQFKDKGSPEEIESLVNQQTIKCQIGQFTKDEERDLQAILNIQRFPNTRKEEAAFLLRLLSEHNCTQRELSKRIGKDENWISMRLKFNKLSENIQNNYLENMPALLAVNLSNLPPHYQDQLIADENLLSLPPADQQGLLKAKVKEYKEFKKIEKGKYHPPAAKFIGFPKWREFCESAEAASQHDVLQGLLMAVGQDNETLENHKLKWEAEQKEVKEETPESIEEQIKALEAKKAKLEART